MNHFQKYLYFLFSIATPKPPVWSTTYTRAAGSTASSSITAGIVEKRSASSPLPKAASVSLFIRKSCPVCWTVVPRTFRPQTLLEAPQHSAAGSPQSKGAAYLEAILFFINACYFHELQHYWHVGSVIIIKRTFSLVYSTVVCRTGLLRLSLVPCALFCFVLFTFLVIHQW